MALANASNPPKRARGRPKGSKTKKTLKEAIARFESNQLEAAQVIIDTMTGNATALGVDSVSLKERVSAAKYVITAPSTMRKGFQDTKQTVEEDEEDTVEAPESKADVVPLVSLSIVDPRALKEAQDAKEALEGN